MKFALSKDVSNAVKVFAALTVMLSHYSQYVVANGISNSIIFKTISSQGGYLGVALFFFMSGYGLMESERKSHLTLKHFFKRRFLKIYLPVLLVSAVWIVLSHFVLANQELNALMHVNSTSDIIYSIFIGFGDGVLWFVKALFVLYAIFYLFSLIYQTNRTAAIVTLLALTLATTFLWAIYVAEFSSLSIPYFALGVMMSLYKEREVKAVAGALIALACIGGGGFIFFNTALAAHSAINAMALCLLILALSVRQWQIRIPAVLGAISFDLYLVHNKVLMTLKTNMDVVPLVLFIGLTLVVTTLFYLLRTKVFKI